MARSGNKKGNEQREGERTSLELLEQTRLAIVLGKCGWITRDFSSVRCLS